MIEILLQPHNGIMRRGNTVNMISRTLEEPLKQFPPICLIVKHQYSTTL
jgi:hypothetical protein